MDLVLIRFSILGPAVGAIGFVFADQILALSNVANSSLSNPNSVGEAIAISGLVLLYSPLVAYPLGLCPACLTGFLFGLLLRRRREHPSAALRFALGSAIGALVAIPLAIVFSPPGIAQSTASAIRWAMAGGLGGGAGALWVTAPVFAFLVNPQRARNAS